MSSASTSRKTGTNHVQKLSVATEQKINQAAELIRNSGMSANSGLGTFRGSAAAV
jgi:hypothetical protein